MSTGLGFSYSGPSQSGNPPLVGIFGADNGLSVSTIDATKVVLGNDVGQVGDPAAFLSDREINANGFRLGFLQDTSLGFFTQIRWDDLVNQLQMAFLFAGAGFGNAGFLMTYDNIVAGFTSQITLNNDGTVSLNPGPAGNVPGVIINGRFVGRRVVVPQIVNYGIGAFGSRTTFTNEGAGALITGTLPPAASGDEYLFWADNVNGHAIQADPADVINFGPGNVTAAGGTITSITTGSFIHLIANNSNQWMPASIVGVWV